MIYVPNKDEYQCYVVQNDSTIRAYKQIPYNPGYNNQITIPYRDFYYTANYLYQDGQQTFNNYTTIPTCLSNDVLTDNFYYRNDFDKICIIFFIFLFINYFIMKKIIRVFFHGRRFA